MHLSDASWRCEHILHARAEEADLEQAAVLLDHWGMAGVVEEFERSIDAYQALYGPLLPGLSLSYDRENASETEHLPHSSRLEQLRALLGRELYQQFMDANALDLALHSHARSLLNRPPPKKKPIMMPTSFPQTRLNPRDRREPEDRTGLEPPVQASLEIACLLSVTPLWL